MRRRLTSDEDAMLRTGFALLGVILLASGALAFDIARGHMAFLGDMCGAQQPHCGWCYAAAGLAAAGLAALVAAARPAPRAAKARI
ncbi:hypothetical protein [Phenylobacterium sp. VNQ135]|uniref:hypothetical protein n=1 Tax=Phenylobacterium sp. VNQ135 TaxID=3400922 RepID=UPI003C309E51